MSFTTVDLIDPVAPPEGKPPRWHVVVQYRCQNGSEVRVHDVEELWEIHMRVEQSFNFLCIEHIVITLNEGRQGDFNTLEESWRQ